MREIKFRAWDKVNTAFMPSEGYAICDGDVMGLRYGNEMEDVLTDQIELMQYTGLKDMNGVDIYENDIVKSNYKYAQPKISQIIMEDGNSYIAGEDLATGNEMLVSDHIDEIEVIGNVHTNLELLEVGK